jgi:outer membrane protein OmpA-like peptidoglycan-associated protein
MMNRKLTVVIAAVVALAGCAEMNQTQKGALIGSGSGALVGALAGQAIGRDTTSTLIGAAAGAAAGGIAGGLIGNYMDKQEAAMRQQMAASEGVSIKRNQDNLDVNFKSDLLFDTNSFTLKGGAMDDLAKFAKVLNDYPQTTVIVTGHTDSKGSAEVNQKLSERRAEAVKNVLVSEAVAPSRITTVGLGESKPVADNGTEAGRAKNRRVDITIKPIPQQ